MSDPPLLLQEDEEEEDEDEGDEQFQSLYRTRVEVVASLNSKEECHTILLEAVAVVEV